MTGAMSSRLSSSTRFWSYSVARFLPRESTIVVRSGDGSLSSRIGSSLRTRSFDSWAPYPSSPAKGMARPAMRTPVRTLTPSMTVICWTKPASGRADGGRRGMP